MLYGEKMELCGVERLYRRKSRRTGLDMTIALHNLTLGKALGGIRFFAYKSKNEAIDDVVRLARTMTYKNAILHKLSSGRLSYGGGKSVIIGDPNKIKTRELLLEAADVINELGGAYIGGEDMGMTVDDIEVMAEKTTFISGRANRTKNGGGDPSEMTAVGVLEGIKACLEFYFGIDYLDIRTLAIQGIGKVGSSLLLQLLSHTYPPNIIVTDKYQPPLDALKLRIAKYPELKSKLRIIDSSHYGEIYDQECDVFVPCSTGGIINGMTINRLRAVIVAGSANNQLLDPHYGELLKERRILYAPDYVINAGGVINVATELQDSGYDATEAYHNTFQIRPLLTSIFRESYERDLPPEVIANEMAENVLRQAGADI